MFGTLMHGPRDVRFEEVPEPAIVHQTDAVIRTVVACVCGSDLWNYRGQNDVTWPLRMGHEYVGVVEEVGSEVRDIRPGQYVIGSFFASDNTCEICRAGFQTSCPRKEHVPGCQAQYIRVPWADGTLVALTGVPDDDLLPSLLALSDVMGTGWYAALAGRVQPGSTVAVVGDGAVGLLAVLAAREQGAERIIAMSRHEPRQKLAVEFGATDIVPERGAEGAERIRELTGGYGAHSVLECVGTGDSMAQAIDAVRPGGSIGAVGVPHGVVLPAERMFFSHIAFQAGPAPVRQYLPDLIERVLSGQIEPGRVFDLTLPLSEVAEAYAAMDERRAVKVLLRP